MQEKSKTTLIVIAVSLAIAGVIYYLGGKAIAFMVKMHGG